MGGGKGRTERKMVGGGGGGREGGGGGGEEGRERKQIYIRGPAIMAITSYCKEHVIRLDICMVPPPPPLPPILQLCRCLSFKLGDLHKCEVIGGISDGDSGDVMWVWWR